MGVVAQSDLHVTITDGKGKELMSFKMGSDERYIISAKNSSLNYRKLSKDEHYWSKETIMEVVKEMASKN